MRPNRASTRFRMPAAAHIATAAAAFMIALSALACSGVEDVGGTEGDTAPDDGHTASSALALSNGCTTEATPEPGLVITEYGPVRGQHDGSTFAYKGISYAAPPVGELRFRRPTIPACIEGEFDASSFGDWCYQATPPPPGVEYSEDCLTLNVWAPEQLPSSPRPVMVWIHGGGNRSNASGQGGDGDPWYNGRQFVEQSNVVFVSINYRLGALGFMAHPALGAWVGSGNYGLLDQIAALEWVRDNIAQFGGDPEQVMVFGQSGGAADICALLTSPLAAGLIDRALMSSGVCAAQPLSQREELGIDMATDMGCDTGDIAGCLRNEALLPQTIVNAQPSPLDDLNPMGMDDLSFGPTVDGLVLPVHPLQAIEDGEHDDIPFAIGSTSYEASLAVQPIVTPSFFNEFVGDHFGQNANQVKQFYSPQIQANARKALIALTTDVTWTCPVRRLARAMAASQSSSVYRYFFTHAMDGFPVSTLGAFHALDSFFVFQYGKASAPLAGLTVSQIFSPAEETLAQNMAGYWSRFAESGNPNGGGPVVWPVNTPTSDAHLQLDNPISTGSAVRPARCDLLDSLL